MLLTIAAILVLLWLLGVVVHIGAFIHLLLIIAIAVFIWDRLVAHRV